ncbi:heavy metal translocating P-type ATPase [Pseudoduganella violaceinigra]|uniref:heavy metal translocating P-type ATPase n=1 Tax=Pseudoduganella violaceinigra TaxID=246602 RepID=UPI0003FD84F1|nr:heavy metal translocating P-type ATPase [Pseudoduganella violaceinigra]
MKMNEIAPCFHCGQPVAASADWQVNIDGVARAMCCPGCAAVAQTIVDIGQAGYYRERSGFAATAGAGVPAALALPEDDPNIIDDGDARATTLLVEGIRCAACVWLIERRLRQVDGVQEASMNVATEKLFLRWHKDKTTAAALLEAVRSIGYNAWPYDATRHDAQLQKASRTLGRQLFVAGLSMMQVMMYVAPEYMTGGDGTLDADMASLMRWASLLLTLPAIAYSAQPFLKGAWASLKARALGMDVPVALGILAAFTASAVSTLRGAGEVYYDSVTMFIFLLLASRYLEMVARRKAASALSRLRHGVPDMAQRLPHWPAAREATAVPASALAAGDYILVKGGEAVAADCVVVDGSTAVDLSLLTGESAPQRKMAGDAIPGGAVNAGGPVVLRVEKPARDSTLAGLLKLIERAGSAKPRIAQWADRAASWFVAALLLFAAASFGFWYWHDAARAWPVAIAVLVVSCPCALSLATPSALAAATDRLLGKGALIVQPHVLETLHRATHIVFDKTGTLTEGRPTVQHVDAVDGARIVGLLRVAAALEAGSAHPLARAIAASADAHGAGAAVASGLQELAGQGMEGVVNGVRYRLGTAAYVAGIAGSAAPAMDRAGQGAPMTTVWLGMHGRWLGRFLVSDALRADARRTVEFFLRRGKEVVLLSGDQQALAERVAGQLGIAGAIGDCLPGEKLAYVQELQRHGAVVAMVGDGINDAAVLSAADVSFAMGSGATLAQVHADCVLLDARLPLLAETARSARRTMRVIRQNLAWATLYNLVGIPAAAFGVLNPWLSGVGMAASSAFVVLNALRLRKG